jgi:hypothetical protein
MLLADTAICACPEVSAIIEASKEEQRKWNEPKLDRSGKPIGRISGVTLRTPELEFFMGSNTHPSVLWQCAAKTLSGAEAKNSRSPSPSATR